MINALIFIFGTILGIVIIFGGFLFMANHHDHAFSITIVAAFLLYCLSYILYLLIG